MEQRKRIIFTVINDLNYDQRMQRICTSLAMNGYEVLLTGRKLPNSKPLFEQRYQQKRLRCFFHKGKFFYLEYNLRLFFFLLFCPADILAPVDADTLVPAFLISRLRKRKLVFDAHEYFSEVPEVNKRPFIQKLWRWVERTFIPHTDLRYTVSQSLAREFEKLYGVPFGVIRNVPVKQAFDEAPVKQPFILYQGALNEGRALEELILAMKNINLPLKLAGEGDLSQQLRNLVATENLQHKVEFLGFVPPKELKFITRQAAIGFNVAHNQGLSYYYSLNNKFFDYMQAAIPSVNPVFPEFMDIIKQYQVGLVCKPVAENIAEAINKLINDKALYETMVNQCILAREKFNWQNEEQQLLQMYERLG